MDSFLKAGFMLGANDVEWYKPCEDMSRLIGERMHIYMHQSISQVVGTPSLVKFALGTVRA